MTWRSLLHPICSALACLCCFSACHYSLASPSPLKEAATVQQLRETYGEVDSSFEREYLLSITSRLTASGILGKLKPVVMLINNAEPVAGSFASGTIVVSRGLLLDLKSEGELAFVLAHEMAHIALGHRAEGSTEKVSVAELAADRLGLALIARSNYDPRVAVSALLHASPAETFWLSSESYPSVQERTQQLQRMIAASGWMPPGTINSRDFDRLQTRLKLLS
ncbi:MAG: M48 family metallopeptidase [Oligoflexia bacterium]|nr:M48 family metallopeptidase [Oligoflexia bacterium]